MREELRTIGSKGRHVFTATFVRYVKCVVVINLIFSIEKGFTSYYF